MTIAALILIAYVLVLAGLVVYSAHRGWLVHLHRRSGGARPIDCTWSGPLPRVTVQLPVYNERHVVERLIDAVCALEYPRERLEIQVLDDSTDDTAERAAARVAHQAGRGLDIRHIRRGSRKGYKAGALAYGLDRARGELLLILDADFVPRPDLLRRMLPAFADPRVGMAQARWGHLNEDANWLTRVQALLLDAHFQLEHGARAAAGLFFNFNGTAGMWRTECIRDAGGWHADTLTEDLDLSYRAQMKGWRFAYLPDVVVPAELPEEMRAFKGQQARWSRGAIQTARKVLPELLRGPWPTRVKVEAVAHLTGHLAYPMLLALSILVLPAALVRFDAGWVRLLSLDLVLFLAGILPLAHYYAAALHDSGRRRWPDLLWRMPVALALGIGISLNNSVAVLAGLVDRRPAEFLRTPKRGNAREHAHAGAMAGYRPRQSRPGLLAEAGLALYLGTGAGYALANGIYTSVPFLMLFVSGFAAVAISSIAGSFSGRALSPGA